MWVVVSHARAFIAGGVMMLLASVLSSYHEVLAATVMGFPTGLFGSYLVGGQNVGQYLWEYTTTLSWLWVGGLLSWFFQNASWGILVYIVSSAVRAVAVLQMKKRK